MMLFDGPIAYSARHPRLMRLVTFPLLRERRPCMFPTYSAIFLVTSWLRIYASISPNKHELAACNPSAVALDRYSISQKRHVDAHYVMGTDVTPVSRRLFGVDWLDNSTIVAGHNESFVTIILDTKRDGHPRQISAHLLQTKWLSKSRQATFSFFNKLKIDQFITQTIILVTHTVVGF
jgi:hypothetical protein